MQISSDMLSSLETKVASLPTYDRARLALRQVHIGLGHFHRAHYLTYLDTLLNAGFVKDWGVFEVDIPPAREQFIADLQKQDYLYSVLSWASDGRAEIRVNGPIIGYANASLQAPLVLDKLSDPSVRLITLTITEKGYCYLDDTHSLNWADPKIARDVEGADPYPCTAVGFLSMALARRAKADAPVTIMSCDNIPENGKVLASCIRQFCEKRYPKMVPWIERNVAFPCTMVDRITPGSTKADTRVIEEKAGYTDLCPVHCEDFLQWVVEDKNATVLPDWEKAGAMVVEHVEPYELMKIRLLNGSHSALSYPAYLMGIRSVDQAATDPLIRRFIRDGYMEEVGKTLPPVPGADVDAYKDKLLSRFSNRSIADTILRLAGDGSKKISNAIVKPLEEAILGGMNHQAMVFALAGWARFCQGKDEQGNVIPIDDPRRERLMATCRDARAFLAEAGVSRLNQAQQAQLHADFNGYLTLIEQKGIKEALSLFLQSI